MAFFISGLEAVGKGSGKREFPRPFKGVRRGPFPCERSGSMFRLRVQTKKTRERSFPGLFYN